MSIWDYFSAIGWTKSLLKRDLAEDGLHPNKAGYSIMAPLATAAVEKAYPTNLCCPDSPVRIYNDLEFSTARPSGIPWLRWRRRQYAGEDARATCSRGCRWNACASRAS